MKSTEPDPTESVPGQDSLDKANDTISKILALGKGEKINLCKAIYRVISGLEPDLQAKALQYTAEVFDHTESSEEIDLEAEISKDETAALTNRYGDVVNALLEHCVDENLDEAAFYRNLWAILLNPLFPNENAKVFALYYMLIDKRIPYFKLDTGLKMSDSDFKAHLRANRVKSAKIRFILAKEFEQRTEQAHLILAEVVDRKSGPLSPDSVVLMADLIAKLRLEGKLQSLFSKIRS